MAPRLGRPDPVSPLADADVVQTGRTAGPDSLAGVGANDALQGTLGNDTDLGNDTLDRGRGPLRVRANCGIELGLGINRVDEDRLDRRGQSDTRVTARLDGRRGSTRQAAAR